MPKASDLEQGDIMYRMDRRDHTFRAFAEQQLAGILEAQRTEVAEQIQQLNANYILNVNEIEYIEHLVSKYEIDIPMIDFDHPAVTDREGDIPAEQFPPTFYVRSGKSYPTQIVIYHLALTGNESYLRYRPSTFLMWSTDVYLNDHALCFDIVNFSDDGAEIQRRAMEIIGNLRSQALNLQSELEAHNAALPGLIKQVFQQRKAAILKQRNLLASLGVPVKTREDTPSTFAISAPALRRKILPQPQASSGAFAPEPTIDEATYREILSTIHEFYTELERHPSTFLGKGEEALRDYLLVQLQPRFAGSTTGETFNKAGKTDILIKYEGKNVFIAECKFWKGPKGFLDTISQLLSYLTWRDSKAAVIIFVRAKAFSPVLEAAKRAAPNHTNYLSTVREVNESWVYYRFHLNGDPGREVKVAVMLFHVPTDAELPPVDEDEK